MNDELFKELDEYVDKTIFISPAELKKYHRLLVAASVRAARQMMNSRMAIFEPETVTTGPGVELNKSAPVKPVMWICDKAGECDGSGDVSVCHHHIEHARRNGCSSGCMRKETKGATCRPVKPEAKPAPEPPKAEIKPGDWVMWDFVTEKRVIKVKFTDPFAVFDILGRQYGKHNCRPLLPDDPYWATQVFSFGDAVEWIIKPSKKWIVQRKSHDEHFCFYENDSGPIQTKELRPWVEGGK